MQSANVLLQTVYVYKDQILPEGTATEMSSENVPSDFRREQEARRE